MANHRTGKSPAIRSTRFSLVCVCVLIRMLRLFRMQNLVLFSRSWHVLSSFSSFSISLFFFSSEMIARQWQGHNQQFHFSTPLHHAVALQADASAAASPGRESFIDHTFALKLPLCVFTLVRPAPSTWRRFLTH